MQQHFLPPTTSQKRVKQLTELSDRTGKTFLIDNFYQGKNINVLKLREQITLAKRHLLQTKDEQSVVNFSSGDADSSSRHIPIDFNQRPKRSTMYKSRKMQPLEIEPTQINSYDFGRKKTLPKDFQIERSRVEERRRIKTLQDQSEETLPYRFSTVDPPSARKTLSLLSTESPLKKTLLNDDESIKQFQSKIQSLWELYEIVVELMQHASKSTRINETLIRQYILFVTGEKLEFIHDFYNNFGDSRIFRSIKLSRVFENFSVFQTCLNTLPRKKLGPAQIINYLGYSSSSTIFIIKILLLTHENNSPFSQKTKKIIQSIAQFQRKSYRTQLRNLKQVIRRLEHNNQIIEMIKTKCGKRYGKYCEQFIGKTIKDMQKLKVPFYECANNIFQFLAFYLHYEEVASNFFIICTPPSPFLSLQYPRTIIIQPYGVLVYRKNNKLLIRAHCGKFLAEISDHCNFIFWTELMPKDAQVLVNLLPVKQNVHWLYRYHCRQQKNTYVKSISLVGCDLENTIIIDNNHQNYGDNLDIGIDMMWRGQKRDVKLLVLSQIVQQIFHNSMTNDTTLREQLQGKRKQINYHMYRSSTKSIKKY